MHNLCAECVLFFFMCVRDGRKKVYGEWERLVCLCNLWVMLQWCNEKKSKKVEKCVIINKLFVI